MGVLLHDLTVRDGVRLSPYCWMARLALEHKGLAYSTVPTSFVAIPRIANGKQKTVPVIEDGGHIVGDSWEIASYLDAAYPDRPSLFGGDAGEAYARFVLKWIQASVFPPMIKTIALDLYGSVLPEDRDHYRKSREQRFGMTLEEFTAAPLAERLAAARAAWAPARALLKAQPFLAGDAPRYADYVAAGAIFCWRSISATPLLAPDDVLVPWFQRLLALYPALARESRRLWDGP